MKYKYEIAFSFLAKDEPLAYELNDLISDRVNTFIYSKRQEELAGTDGELTFNKVFSGEARIVVVLYRDGWGQTPWTRIEETAIRNRAYSEGWDFVIYVLLDKNSKVPKYLPKAQLWIDYERWGLKGIAPILEQRVKDEGGEFHEETIQSRMERLKRSKMARQKRLEYLLSREAYDDSFREIKLIFNELKTIKPKLEDNESGFHLDTAENQHDYYEFGFRGLCLLFRFEGRMNINSGVESKLTIIIYQKTGPANTSNYNETTYYEEGYRFDQSLSEAIGWSDDDKEFWTSKQLIEYWVKKFLEEIDIRKIKQEDKNGFWAF